MIHLVEKLVKRALEKFYVLRSYKLK